MAEHVRPRGNDRTLSGRIGVAGCGRMGGPMLRALMAAGFDASGYDIDMPGMGELAPSVTDDPDRFASGLRTLLTVVRDEAQTEDVLFGGGNLVDRGTDLNTIIVCSTLSPRYVGGLRPRIPAGITLIDAPMSGAQIAAQRRTLSFMQGGSTEDLARLQPLFDAMGSHFHHMGPLGAGMQAKVLNNLLAASSTAMTRLVLDWADTAGLDERALLDLFETSSGRNWLASGFDEIEFARDGWSADNSIGILTKDIEAALDAAPDGADTSLPHAVRGAIRALRPRPRKT